MYTAVFSSKNSLPLFSYADFMTCCLLLPQNVLEYAKFGAYLLTTKVVEFSLFWKIPPVYKKPAKGGQRS